jgi:hypothetical protein
VRGDEIAGERGMGSSEGDGRSGGDGRWEMGDEEMGDQDSGFRAPPKTPLIWTPDSET